MVFVVDVLMKLMVQSLSLRTVYIFIFPGIVRSVAGYAISLLTYVSQKDGSYGSKKQINKWKQVSACFHLLQTVEKVGRTCEINNYLGLTLQLTDID